MRLINAERYAEKIREHANVLRDENPTSIAATMAAMSYDIAADEAMKEPTIDAAPVVRCRDCTHCNSAGCAPGFGWCERSGHDHGTTDDWFCADGEMKYDRMLQNVSTPTRSQTMGLLPWRLCP